ncbi:response regulator [bacterium]|nr:MAG: response regulator [bacterium]
MPTTASMSLTLPAAPEDNRFRLLLVEDDSEKARLILSFLERTGFDCRLAGDADIAMTTFSDLRPHMLLTEFASASVDGQALCRWVREKSAIPIMAFGPKDESAEVVAFKLGADDYLANPLHPAVLMARVVSSLRRAYRYNTPPKPDNPFGLEVEDAEGEGILPSGWARCDTCGYAGPRSKFEQEDYIGEIKVKCPNCKSTEHVVFSLD